MRQTKAFCERTRWTIPNSEPSWRSGAASDTEVQTELTRRNYEINALFTDPAYALLTGPAYAFQCCNLRRSTAALRRARGDSVTAWVVYGASTGARAYR